MPQSAWIPFFIVAAGISIIVLLLASTRRSLSGPWRLPSGRALDDSKYPSGYWMSIGIATGVVSGLALGLVTNSIVGGTSVGIGIGLILGKLLTQRFDKETRQYTKEEKLERQRRAGWGLIVMVLLVLGTLVAAVLPLLESAP